ncbi:hypothetical protein HID58_045176 [Brassica napus]|uniref:Uncharacterized protein n=1 Tax=Brassica napus TaxID=3708 RepID=A0ABQ8AT21_BRANA|nr:uncharacterized protein LOC111204494 [Brassica napus]KAH0895608.1 hypothetical protein HID58_045176 [Brassica napus]
MDNQAKCCLGAMIQKTEEQVFEGSYVIHGKDENESLIKFMFLELDLQNCKDVYEALDNFVGGVDKNTVNLKENEMDEASLMMIKVCVDSDHDKSCTFKTHKEATFESFKDDVAEYFGVEEHRLRFYTSEAASSLVLSRSYSATVEQVVKSDTVLVKFDTKPGVTGICDLCPRVNLDDVLDMEDYGREPRVIKPKATKRPSKRYNK